MENEITATANKYFKITPKSEQIETINSYMNNKDTVMVAPTGFGKSLIYQIAPLLFDKDKVYCQQQSSSNNSNMSRLVVENKLMDILPQNLLILAPL